MTSITFSQSTLSNFSKILYIHAIGKVKGLIPSVATTNEKIDSALRTVSRVGDLAGIISGVGDSFAAFGLATEKVATWTTPLLIAGMALRAAGLAFTTKSLIETHVFSKQFKAVSSLNKNKYDNNDFSKSVNLISSKSFLEKSFIKKHFGVDREKLTTRLSKVKLKAEVVFASDDKERQEKYSQKLKKIVTLLDNRIKVMKQSKAFLITASVVSIVATIVLLCSPASPVGFILVGLLAAVEIIHFARMWQLKKTFEKALKINQ